MDRETSINRSRVRNRRVAVYTFVLILALFYISAHETVRKRQEAETSAVAEMTAPDRGAPPEAGTIEKTSTIAESGMHGKAGKSPALAVGGQAPEQDAAGEEALSISGEDLWCLILTNAEYPVPENYTVELKTVPGTEQTVDARIYDPLMSMLEAMRTEGLSPVVCSGYRTLDKQEKLFNRKVQSYVRRGSSKAEAYELARRTISIPGSGEHCLGLAVDFFTKSYHKLEREFEDTPEGIWLMAHAQEYGFILRYPDGREDITGIEYEPWHYRYVGVEAARYIMEHNLTLEEFYLEQSLYG